MPITLDKQTIHIVLFIDALLLFLVVWSAYKTLSLLGNNAILINVILFCLFAGLGVYLFGQLFTKSTKIPN